MGKFDYWWGFSIVWLGMRLLGERNGKKETASIGLKICQNLSKNAKKCQKIPNLNNLFLVDYLSIWPFQVIAFVFYETSLSRHPLLTPVLYFFTLLLQFVFFFHFSFSKLQKFSATFHLNLSAFYFHDSRPDVAQLFVFLFILLTPCLLTTSINIISLFE